MTVIAERSYSRRAAAPCSQGSPHAEPLIDARAPAFIVWVEQRTAKTDSLGPLVTPART